MHAVTAQRRGGLVILLAAGLTVIAAITLALASRTVSSAGPTPPTSSTSSTSSSAPVPVFCIPGDPSCTVTVGTGSHGGSPAQSGAPVGGGTSDGRCHNTDPNHGCDPCAATGPARDAGACTASIQNLFCSQLNPAGMDPAAWSNLLQTMGCTANAFVPPNPAVLAQQALATIVIPRPSGHRSPSETQLYRGFPITWVHLWLFYWNDPATWHPLTATAAAGGASATVTATPTQLQFDPGDGNAPVVCAGPGRPWTDADGNSPPSDGACGYQYTRVTSSPITSTQTIVWAITWTGTGGTSGDLPDLSTSTSGQLNVLQIQTVVTR